LENKAIKHKTQTAGDRHQICIEMGIAKNPIKRSDA